MIKINYVEPKELETPDDIAESNIKICNQYRKTDYLELSCISWLKLDSERNYQDLAKLFEKLELDTYILAQPITTIPTGLRIGKPNECEGQENLKYIAKIICVGKEYFMNELLKYHSGIEENNACLKLTGCLMALKQEKIEEKEKKLTEIKGVDEVKKLLECKLKLDLEYYSVKESIDFIIQDLTNKHGKEPEKIICGEIDTNKVWGLMIDGQIASPIGWVEKNVEKNIDIEKNTDIEKNINLELVDFRKISIERT